MCAQQNTGAPSAWVQNVLAAYDPRRSPRIDAPPRCGRAFLRNAVLQWGGGEGHQQCPREIECVCNDINLKWEITLISIPRWDSIPHRHPVPLCPYLLTGIVPMMCCTYTRTHTHTIAEQTILTSLSSMLEQRRRRQQRSYREYPPHSAGATTYRVYLTGTPGHMAQR